MRNNQRRGKRATAIDSISVVRVFLRRFTRFVFLRRFHGVMNNWLYAYMQCLLNGSMFAVQKMSGNFAQTSHKQRRKASIVLAKASVPTLLLRKSARFNDATTLDSQKNTRVQ